jgi:Polyketide cyclase / dehydrase and lipid transport
MARITLSTVIDAPRRRVWREVRDLPTHSEWMEDAVAIRFLNRRRSGVGTAYDCDTRLGPFRLTDRMEVVEWRRRRLIGIRHTGLVTGRGRFLLRRRGRRRTTFVWDERLAFPWWLGGPVTGLVARPVLGRVWRRNLTNLKARVESGA